MLDFLPGIIITICEFIAYIVFLVFAYKGIKAFDIYIKKNL